MIRPDYPIRTERLALRPWRSDDLDRYHQLRGDPEVARFLYDEPLSRRQAADKLAGLRTKITEPGQWINLAVELTADRAGAVDTHRPPGSQVVGDVGLCWVSDAHRQAEIGYAFHADSRGRGYAAEAAAAMVGLAFSLLGAHRVSGRLDARNLASAALLDRLGMRREGHFVENEFVKGEWTDEVVYAVLDHEWQGWRPA